MKGIMRSRPSPAMVVALISLFVALSGVSWAALKKDSVGPKQIKANAVGTSELANDGATGTDVKESTFGEVPRAANATSADTLDGADSSAFLGRSETAANAETLDGVNGSDYVRGTAELVRGRVILAQGASATLLEAPGVARLTATCSGNSDNLAVVYKNLSSGNQAFVRSQFDEPNATSSLGSGLASQDEITTVLSTTGGNFAGHTLTIAGYPNDSLAGSGITIFVTAMTDNALRCLGQAVGFVSG